MNNARVEIAKRALRLWGDDVVDRSPGLPKGGTAWGLHRALNSRSLTSLSFRFVTPIAAIITLVPVLRQLTLGSTVSSESHMNQDRCAGAED